MRQRVNLVLVLAIAGVIAYFSVRPLPAASYSAGGLNIALLYHAFAYFALAGALLLYVHDTMKGHAEAVAAAVLFGAGLELVQGQLPGRYFAITDMLVNTAGASLVLLDHRVAAVSWIVEKEDALLEQVIR